MSGAMPVVVLSISGGATATTTVEAVPASSTKSGAETGNEDPPETKEELTARLTKLTTQAQVVLFMKGDPETLIYVPNHWFRAKQKVDRWFLWSVLNSK